MNTITFFQRVGFSREESKILSYLSKHKRQSILQIARGTGIERTKVYRLIDSLLENGFVTQSKDYKSNYYSIGAISKFYELKEKEIEKARFLDSNWANLVSILTENTTDQSTDVRFYKGKEGIKQIQYNELNANKEILSFTYRNVKDIVGKKFFTNWAKEIELRGIILKDLRTQSFDKFDKKMRFKPSPFKGDYIRYLPDKYKDFHLAVDIYNDIVVLYEWRDNDAFAVEIQNKNFAKFMKMLFNDYWELAKPRKDVI